MLLGVAGLNAAADLLAEVSRCVQSPGGHVVPSFCRHVTKHRQANARGTHALRRSHVLRNLVLVGLIVLAFPAQAASQGSSRKYVAGIRSALIVGTMNLSRLDPAFDDLEADGPNGPHMSGFFLQYTVRPHVRVGVETLVASSDQNSVTTMNYQAAGPVVELTYGNSWFVSGGLHAGGLIVNAMSRPSAAAPRGATTGSYFKGNGVFVSPYADLGYRFRRGEVSAFVKRVGTSGEKARGGISNFGSTFAGLRVGVGL